MLKTSLVIMAAGLGSRFGGGIKQLEPIDLNGHIIMDYSIHDAIEAGFNQIVFVIRKDILDDFQMIIGERIKEVCKKNGVEINYAFQTLESIPAAIPEGRTKPWGTGQAVLSAAPYINSPFAVINADDYYGKKAFKDMHDWLAEEHKPCECAMSGFLLKNTLSNHGGVTRGICNVDSENHLRYINETKNIQMIDERIVSGSMVFAPNTVVSMNMWGLQPFFLTILEDQFKKFFRNEAAADPLNSEFLLPIIIGKLLKEHGVSVEVLETNDSWFGVTYKEDKEAVIQSFKNLIDSNVYTESLYRDL